jgi:hypothetical protein
VLIRALAECLGKETLLKGFFPTSARSGSLLLRGCERLSAQCSYPAHTGVSGQRWPDDPSFAIPSARRYTVTPLHAALAILAPFRSTAVALSHHKCCKSLILRSYSPACKAAALKRTVQEHVN